MGGAIEGGCGPEAGPDAGKIEGGSPTAGAPEGAPRTGAAIDGDWPIGSIEDCRGGWSQGCGARLLTLMRFCGLFAACTACTAWADD